MKKARFAFLVAIILLAFTAFKRVEPADKEPKDSKSYHSPVEQEPVEKNNKGTGVLNM